MRRGLVLGRQQQKTRRRERSRTLPPLDLSATRVLPRPCWLDAVRCPDALSRL